MEFNKYQHIERLNTDETEGIELGEVYAFPKIDGTNASMWLDDGVVCAGSRNRVLSPGNDNHGFCCWAFNQRNITRFLNDHPDLRLYGEWLVKHTFENYRPEAMKDFYVFDVCDDYKYLHYEEYKLLLEKYEINYIPPLCVFENPSSGQMHKTLEKNNYLVIDGGGNGEGVVFKNYSYRNKYGRQTWAKLVSSEFKEKHTKCMGAPVIKGVMVFEDKIVENYCTEAFIQKEFEKIKAEKGWNSKMIPMLLGVIYHELITEETWNFIKKYKSPVIDFSLLNKKVVVKIKSTLPELF